MGYGISGRVSHFAPCFSYNLLSFFGLKWDIYSKYIVSIIRKVSQRYFDNIQKKMVQFSLFKSVTVHVSLKPMKAMLVLFDCQVSHHNGHYIHSLYENHQHMDRETQFFSIFVYIRVCAFGVPFSPACGSFSKNPVFTYIRETRLGDNVCSPPVVP